MPSTGRASAVKTRAGRVMAIAATDAAGAKGMDYVFLVSLGLAAFSGLLTLILRDTSAMGSLLVLHLAFIAALFITAPYGKFVHFVYRTLALIRYEIEQRQPQQRVGH